MNITVSKNRKIEKNYSENEGTQNENKITVLSFTFPQEYSSFTKKIVFITEDGNFFDYIENDEYVIKNNVTAYRKVKSYVWLSNTNTNEDFRSELFDLNFFVNEDPTDAIPSEQQKSQIDLLIEELDAAIAEVEELREETYTREEVEDMVDDKIADDLTNYYTKNQTYNKTQVDSAIGVVENIAKGANQSLSYSNYSSMITAFNGYVSNKYNVGQNVMIVTLEVPDLWISSVEESSTSYTYTTDEAFTNALKTNGYVQVGYYKFSALETQKVDLSDYYTKTQADNKFVEKETGKGLSTNDYTTTEKNKLSGIESGAEVNAIETVKVNGTALVPDGNKAVNIDISGKEDKTNKTATIDANSTNTQYAGAKAVYDYVQGIVGDISDLLDELNGTEV